MDDTPPLNVVAPVTVPPLVSNFEAMSAESVAAKSASLPRAVAISPSVSKVAGAELTSSLILVETAVSM